MLIDNKGKLFGKINIVDLCVILILIIAVCVTYFKFNLSAHSDVSSSNGTVSFEITSRGVRQFTVDSVSIGDKVFDKETDKYVGEVTGISTAPAYEFITRTDGKIVSAELPERYNFIVTVECPAVIKDGSAVTESGKQIYLNQKTAFYTQRMQTEFEVTDVKY